MSELKMIPEEDYFAIPALSRSQIKDCILSPSYYKSKYIDKHPYLWREQKSTKAQEIGSRFDDLISLEPDEYAEKHLSLSPPVYTVAPSWALTAGGNLSAKADVKERLTSEFKGEVFLTPGQAVKEDDRYEKKIARANEEDQFFQFLRMKFFENNHIAQIEKRIEYKQPVILWDNDIVGPMKARLDDLGSIGGQHFIADTKITSKDPDSFGTEVIRWGYDLQQLVYQDAVLGHFGEQADFYLRVIQYVKPYKVKVVTLDSAVIARAQTQIARALRMIADNDFKTPDQSTAELPAWAFYGEES